MTYHFSFFTKLKERRERRERKEADSSLLLGQYHLAWPSGHLAHVLMGTQQSINRLRVPSAHRVYKKKKMSSLQTNVCLIYLYLVIEGKAIVIVLVAPVHQTRGVSGNSPLGLDTPCPHPHPIKLYPSSYSITIKGIWFIPYLSSFRYRISNKSPSWKKAWSHCIL